MASTKLSNDQLKEIERRVRDGERVRDLAAEFGVSDKTIYYYIRQEASTDGTLLELNKLKRENKSLKELVGLITYELNKEKKLL
jgi:transposase